MRSELDLVQDAVFDASDFARVGNKVPIRRDEMRNQIRRVTVKPTKRRVIYGLADSFVHWFTGSLVCWFAGSLVHWFTGAQVHQ